MKNALSAQSPRRRSIARTCIAAAMLAGLGLFAQAATPAFAATQHHVKISLKEAPIYVTNGPDPSGPPARAREAGLFTGSLGNGVDSTDVHVIAGRGTRVFYTRNGSLQGWFVFTGVRKSNGDTIVGTLTITGGTGRYSHAHGTLHISGFHNDTTSTSVEHLNGTLTY